MEAERTARPPEDAAAGNGASRAARIALVLIVVAGAALRLVGLGRDSLWGDEGHTALRGESPYTVVVRRHCQPVYVLALLTTALGRGEAAIRLPHALLGAASIGLVGLLGARRVGAGAGLCAALVLAVSPAHVAHSMEARFYSLMVFLTLLSQLSLDLAIDRGNRRWWIAFAGTAILNVHNHPFGAVAVLAQLGYLVSVRPSRPSFAAGGLVFAGALALAWTRAPSLVGRLLRGAAATDPSRWDWGTDALHETVSRLGAGPGPATWIHAAFFLLGAIVLLVLRRRALAMVLSQLLAAALAIALLERTRPDHPYFARYLSFLIPYAAIAVGAGVAWLSCALLAAVRRPSRRRREPRPPDPFRSPFSAVVATAILVPIAIPALQDVHASHGGRYREVARHVSGLAAPGDLVLVGPAPQTGHWAVLLWYFSRRYPLPDGVRLDRVPGGAPGPVAGLPESRGRSWLIDVEPVGSGGGPRPEGTSPPGAVEVLRIPNAFLSRDLGRPEVLDELVVRTWIRGP